MSLSEHTVTVAGTDAAGTVLRQLAQLRTARSRGDALIATQSLTHAMICATFQEARIEFHYTETTVLSRTTPGGTS